jgi:hypothetical protein
MHNILIENQDVTSADDDCSLPIVAFAFVGKVFFD